MLEASEIWKSYKKRPILRGVSLCAEPGQCIGIAGGNGCGKTTLLSILAGIRRPDSGTVRVNGVSIRENRKIAETGIAYVPQENPFIPELTAGDNYRLWFRGDRKKMESDLENGVGKALGLAGFIKTPAGKLSGGAKNRLRSAAALSNRAPVLILDEPGAALDLAAKEQIIDYVNQYRESGGSVILTSHEMEELRLCTHLFVLKNGCLQPVSAGLTSRELIALF